MKEESDVERKWKDGELEYRRAGGERIEAETGRKINDGWKKKEV